MTSDEQIEVGVERRVKKWRKGRMLHRERNYEWRREEERDKGLKGTKAMRKNRSETLERHAGK
jgi:hypothetical protein